MVSMRVGIQGRDYLVSRNIADLVKGIEYVRVYDVCELIRKACRVAMAVTGLFGGARQAIYTSAEDRFGIANAITSGLGTVVRNIVQNRSDIQRKADVALERIRVEHSPERHAEQLRAIYQAAVVDKKRLAGDAYELPFEG